MSVDAVTARYVGALFDLAEEKGEDFDESTVTGPMDFFQIEGVGAVVDP